MKRFLLPLLFIPLILSGCKNKPSSSEQEQNMISLSETSITLSEDKTHQLVVNVDDSLKNYLMFWSMRDESIATVVDGLVTAKKVGLTICTVQVGKYSANCAVNVTNFEPEATLNIVVNNDEINLNVGDVYDLPIMVYYGAEIITNYSIIGEPSDDAVVSFANNKIAALRAGQSDILLTVSYEEETANKLIYVTVY